MNKQNKFKNDPAAENNRNTGEPKARKNKAGEGSAGKKKASKEFVAPKKTVSQANWVRNIANKHRQPTEQASEIHQAGDEHSSPARVRYSEAGDEHLAQDIQEAIRKQILLSRVLDHIHVMVENRVVTLDGKVFSKEEKRLVGDMAVDFVGPRRVRNNLDVIHPK